MRKFIALGLISSTLMSCSLAPKYQRPVMPIPEHFKEATTETLWIPAKTIAPATTLAPWWQSFQDPTLNRLEEQLTLANQDVRVAYFRYEQARALVQVARARFFPTISGIGNADRQQTSTTIANPSSNPLYNNFLLGTDLSYEVDVWGSIRNAVAKNQNLARASAAELAAISLSLHAELASDYFTLRGYDESQRILNTTVAAYERALFLTTKRYQGGASPAEDVDNAQAQLENAKTLAADMHLKRSQLEHAIAVLVGEIPSNFALAPAKLPIHVLKISPNMPSTLLERRPDIAAAEFKVKAANANIGIARAAFFPAFNLTSVIGFQSQVLSNLLSKPSLFWSLGPVSALSVAQPVASVTLFDGGRLFGLLRQAKASYYETVASYRQTVLTSFQEVEDALIAIRQLDKEKISQSAASKAANRALQQANNRYRGGIATFLDVVVVENIALQSDLARVNVSTKRQIASIQLIKALGGGWASYPHPKVKKSNQKAD
ncbi:efflux transporter outer membrane subunit [Legionella sp. km772]|uniref:efflux transporter outer membrane subunit n=1 Tax=Legionella sp. km772 TaxID=2498111 RepID=UPI000F8CBAEC|nr:efflux transporter outer membrane subunit [Legionella sp. km772]RUR06442.1 efflux transporter outer membrane subunit [Legionella sp. km772]